MIIKKNNKWVVTDSSGKKVLGTHSSKEKATKQLAAIEISKKEREKEVNENLEKINNTMSDLNKELIESLIARIELLEKKLKKSDKKANKDYDGDGKIESGSEEYLGSRDRAIKKAMGKKIDEALDRVGGNVNMNSPTIRSLVSKVEKSNVVESVVNKLNEGKKTDNKSFKDQGTRIQLSENLTFGGFPRIIKEENKKGIAPEVMTALVQDNNPEEYKEFAPGHSPLPKDIHDAVRSLVSDEVGLFSYGDIDVSEHGPALGGHIKNIRDALEILNKSGHDGHLVAQYLDRIRGRIQDAIGTHEYNKDIRSMRASGTSSFS